MLLLDAARSSSYTIAIREETWKNIQLTIHQGAIFETGRSPRVIAS